MRVAQEAVKEMAVDRVVDGFSTTSSKSGLVGVFMQSTFIDL
jgi:hypothetical protein